MFAPKNINHNDTFTLKKLLITALVASAVSACGGGGGGGSDTEVDTNGDITSNGLIPVSRNYALAREGATVSSNYSGNETFVNDGMLDEDGYWEPGADGDFIQIDLENTPDVKNIRVLHHRLSRSALFRLEVSEDGVVFNELDLDEDCLISAVTIDDINCELLPTLSLKSVRLTILDASSDIKIYEIQTRKEFAARNLASPSLGASISSSNNDPNSRFVIDEVVGDGNYWAPDEIDDYLTLALEGYHIISVINIDYTASVVAPFEIMTSLDGENFSDEDLLVTHCFPLEISATNVSCTLVVPDTGAIGKGMIYARLTVFDSIDDLQINEIRVHSRRDRYCPPDYGGCSDVQIIE